jgi:hypothetical protein
MTHTPAAGTDGTTRVPVALGDRSYDILIGDGLWRAPVPLVAAPFPARMS